MLITARDVNGLAETGSGKTGAFALPILQVGNIQVPQHLMLRGYFLSRKCGLTAAAVQGLLESPGRFYALILSPTRELALQIKEQIEALGAGISVRCAALVGGIDMPSQVCAPCRVAKLAL